GVDGRFFLTKGGATAAPLNCDAIELGLAQAIMQAPTRVHRWIRLAIRRGGATARPKPSARFESSARATGRGAGSRALRGKSATSATARESNSGVLFKREKL